MKVIGLFCSNITMQEPMIDPLVRWYRDSPVSRLPDGSILVHATWVDNAHMMVEQLLAACDFVHPVKPYTTVKIDFKNFICGKPLLRAAPLAGKRLCCQVQQGNTSYLAYDSGIPLDRTEPFQPENFPFQTAGVTEDRCRWIFRLGGTDTVSGTECGVKLARTYRTISKTALTMSGAHAIPFLVIQKIDVPMRLTGLLALNMEITGKALKRVRFFDSGFIGEAQTGTGSAFWSPRMG